MSDMQVSGKIYKIGETLEVGSNGFLKRELVVETQDQYPQLILIEFIKEKCMDLNTFEVGQEVIVSINLRGREWVNPTGESKFFNSLQGWKVAKVGGEIKLKSQENDEAKPPF
tara:strand:+ start:3650 stop:3988 length:339 start_codon:yes stop_codon:yes gene_type:complete